MFYNNQPDTSISVVDISGGVWDGVTLPGHWPNNAFQVDYPTSGDQEIGKFDSTFLAPSVGDRRFHRFFWISNYAASQVRANHGVQSNFGGVAWWLTMRSTEADGDTRMSLEFNSGETKYWGEIGSIPDSTPVRVEIRFELVHADTVIPKIWVYNDVTNTILQSPSSFGNSDNAPSIPHTSTLADEIRTFVDGSGTGSVANALNNTGMGFTSTFGAHGKELFAGYIISDDTLAGQFVPHGGN